MRIAEKHNSEELRWEQLRRKHGSAVWGVVYRILAHYEDARDCLQEVFFDAYRSPSAETVRNWRAYLCWLATRRAIDRLRTRREKRCEPLLSEPMAPRSVNPAEQSETGAIIREELDRLPEAQATAFWMSCVEQLTYQEIAEQMQTTSNAVGLLIHRARHQLKQKLRHLMEDR